MGTRFVSVLSLLAMTLNASAALAAEPAESAQPYGQRDTEAVDLTNAYEPEAVYVTKVAAKAQDGAVTGSFTILNTEETLVTGLQYRLELRGVGEEDGLPYSLDVVRASVALAPNESKTLLLASRLPNMPAGRYDLRVQVLTAKGRSLGWMDTPVVVQDADASDSFVHLFPGTIGVAAYGDTLLAPLSGPNVEPSSSLTLHATAINKGDAAIRVKPVVEIFDFNAARVTLNNYEFSAVNVAAGESMPLAMPIDAEAQPGVYMAHVTLQNADTLETISTIAQYRFVVKGKDADIVSAGIDNMGTKGGDWAYGTVDLVGSADALSKTTATLRVQLMDEAGVLGAIEVPNVELTDAILSAKIRIPLDRDLVGSPSLDVSLLSAENATYDHAVYAGTLTPAQIAGLTADASVTNWVAWHGMARISLFAFLAVLIGYALFSLGIRLRGGNVAFLRSATAAFLLLAMVTQVTSGFAAGSGGIEVLTPKNGADVFAPLGNRPIVALFINSPVHNQANNFCNRQVTLSYRVEYGVCENQIANVRVLGRVASGHINSYDPAGTQWTTVHDRAFVSDLCTQSFCFATDNFTGTLNLTNAVPANATEATLQLVAKYGKNIAMPDSSFDRNDQFIRVGWVHAMNVHMQCEPQVGCVEILKETFDSQNVRTTPVPQFTFKLDGNQTAVNDSQGRAIFQNVTPGTHTLTEVVPAGWENFLVTPTNGTVQVSAGNNCAAVVFKNRLEPQDADLQVVKTGPQTVVRGSVANYSLAVKNNGPASAPNTIVRDTIPAGTTFNAAQSDTRCQLQGNSVACNLGTLTAGQTVTVSLALNVANPDPAACVPGSIVNQAAVLSDRQDRDLQNNQSTVTTQATCPQPQVGCVEVLKEGFDANNQRITTALPGFTFKLDNNQTVTTDGQGRATFQNVTPGSHTITENQVAGWTNFLVTPTGGTVNVPAGTNCAAVVFKNRQNPQDADLQVIKTGPASVLRGTTATYALAVKNNGTVAAPNTIVRDEVPAGTTFVAAQSDTRCQLQGNSVACNLGTLAAGQTITVQVTFNVPAAYAPTTVVNRAAVLSDLQDNNLQNNQSSVTTPVTSNMGCIEILKEGFDAGGSRLTTVPPFTFNLDGSGALNVHTDSQGRARFSNVPAGQHTVSEQTASGWTLFLVTPLNGLVNVPAGNDCAAVVFKNRQVAQNADVSVVKAGPSTAVRGGNLTYSLTVTNAGPATAQNVIVDDTLPTGLTNPVVSGQGCAVNNGVVRCQVGTLAVGEQRVITVNVQVPSVAQNCQNSSVTNTATVTSSNDPATANNTSSVTTQLQCPVTQQADLQITKTGPASVVRGNVATYSLAVKNNGPSSSPNTIVGDPLPAGTTFNAAQSDSRCTLSNNTIFCNLGTMTSGQTITLAVALNVTASTGACQTSTLVNQAAVQGDLQDTNMQNNQSSATTQVTCAQGTGADVSVVKTGPASVARGSTLTYQLVVSNAGPASASGVVLSDAIPAGTTYQSSDSSCTVTNGTITCQLGTIASGQTRTIAINLGTAQSTGTCTAGSVTNTGIVTTASTDPNGANNQSSATTQLTCQDAQLGCIDVIKETYDTNGNVLTPVTQFSFSLDGTRTAVNDSLGRARFENVPVGSHTVTETVTTNWTQMSVTPTNGTVNVTAAGTCATVTFKNRQSVSTGNGWTISKTDNESEVEPGDTLTYRITVKNNSSTRQTNVTITDTLPSDVNFEDATPNETSENGRMIRWENQTFEAGETRIYEVEVEVDDDAEGTLTNTAEVAGITATDRTDVEEDDNEDVEIDLTKTASTSEVFPGGIIDYTVRVKNTGDDTIEDITVIDTLPADVIIIDDGDADSRSGRRLEWEIDELEEGDEEIFRYRVSVPTYMVPGQVIRNDVCVESDDLDDETCESVNVSVLGQIPTTGAKTNSLPNEHLKPVAKTSSSADDGSMPFLAVIALAGAASGAGIGFGRKLLFGI
jgi:uncharacterized repeat protein (TIGR01451 family)